MPAEERRWAYADHAMRIGHGQTISQPYMVASMTEALALTGSERVLDVGTGSGYQAAIFSHLVSEVHTIDLVPELVERAKTLIRELGLSNIHFHVGDGSLGLPEKAPFDAILVAAAAPKVPLPLLEQLEDQLLMADVGIQATQQITERLTAAMSRKELNNEESSMLNPAKTGRSMPVAASVKKKRL